MVIEGNSPVTFYSGNLWGIIVEDCVTKYKKKFMNLNLWDHSFLAVSYTKYPTIALIYIYSFRFVNITVLTEHFTKKSNLLALFHLEKYGIDQS